MNKKGLEYLRYLAMLDLTTYHYKILLLLNVEIQSQSQLAQTLEIQKQNIYKYVKELETFNLIEIDRVEGKNKYYRAVVDTDKIRKLLPGQTKMQL